MRTSLGSVRASLLSLELPFSLNAICTANSFSAIAKRPMSEERVRQLILPSVRLALATSVLRGRDEHANTDEFKVTILMNDDGDSTTPTAAPTAPASTTSDATPHVAVYVEPMPVRQPPIVVELRAHAQRSDPSTKNTAWVHEREQLERSKARDVDEVVMYDADADASATSTSAMLISEGLSSNFGVLDSDGGIVTARPGARRVRRLARALTARAPRRRDRARRHCAAARREALRRARRRAPSDWRATRHADALARRLHREHDARLSARRRAARLRRARRERAAAHRALCGAVAAARRPALGQRRDARRVDAAR